MADIKISALTDLGTSPDAADELVIVDKNVVQTKKVTIADLFTNPNVTGTVTADGLTVDGTARIGSLYDWLIDDSTLAAGASLSASTTVHFGTTGNNSVNLYSNNTRRLAVSNNGDISFFEDTGTTPKFFWDASAESLGIGTTSPSTHLDVTGGTTNQVAIFRSSDATATIGFADNTTPLTGNLSYVTVGAVGNNMVFNTNLVEAARIDSSGNLLVGTTVAPSTLITTSTTSNAGTGISDIGYLSVARDLTSFPNSGGVAFFNRLATDGPIADFRKDGSTVGSIGSYSNDLYIGNDDVGLLFNNASNYMTPHAATSNTPTDGSMDIGASSRRFKDLYLSGGVYLGGAGADNLLDDYEEGTFVATMSASTSGTITLDSIRDTLSYTKTGRIVHITGRIDVSAVSSPSGGISIDGLPFASAELAETAEQVSIGLYIVNAANNAETYIGRISGGSTSITILASNNSGAATSFDGNELIFVSGFYLAA